MSPVSTAKATLLSSLVLSLQTHVGAGIGSDDGSGLGAGDGSGEGTKVGGTDGAGLGASVSMATLMMHVSASTLLLIAWAAAVIAFDSVPEVTAVFIVEVTTL